MCNGFTDKLFEIKNILIKVNAYLNENIVFENVVYCFRDKALKETMREYLPKFEINSDYYTELTIEFINQKLCLSHKNSPIYIYGEYKKFSRHMTQTPLKIKGKLKCEKSVSDFTNQIKEIYGAKEVVFIPSGREDIDVMKLGGRPFLLKIKEPTSNLFVNLLSLKIYPEIELQNFKRVSSGVKDHILEGEKDKMKYYRCFIACRNRINIQSHYEVVQKTPLRVLHRRANVVREKTVEVLNCEEKEECNFWLYKVDLKASAGTYIKEFVNGDFGRTVPSLNLNKDYTDLIYLDVLKIENCEIPNDLIFEKVKLKLNN